MRKLIIHIAACISLLAMTTTAQAFTEPSMNDYTAYPIFTNEAVTPNIFIMLDNSGSMNYPAYGPEPADDKLVVGGPFEGEPYSSSRTFRLIANADDAEETAGGGSVWLNGDQDLDFGEFIVGMRFQNVDLPQGVTIQSAFIEFIADENGDDDAELTIFGENVDNATVFMANDFNISGRTKTDASVLWVPDPWTSGDQYSTPDVAALVQEIVDRPDWSAGNAMAFIVNGTGKRAATSRERGSAYAAVLRVVFDNPGTKRYYGYFSPDHFYKYGSNSFELMYRKVGYDYGSNRWNVTTLGGAAGTLSNSDISSQQLWDGNWLNWLCMRRIDVMRKVLMGGLATSRTGGGNQTNIGETPAQTNRRFRKAFDSTFSAVSPYIGDFTYRMLKGQIEVAVGATTITYNIRVNKDINHEPTDFTADGNLGGVLQRIGGNARWGNMWFNKGTGSNQSGGTVAAPIGTNLTNLANDLQNTGCDTWTPLAESYYVAMQYFRQQNAEGSLDYPNNAVKIGSAHDPYYNGNEYVWCAKSFVLLLTDGASTMDTKVPSALRNYSDLGHNTSCWETSNSNCDYPDFGTNYLTDVAYYARTVDLRPELEGEQNLRLYTVYAFGNDPNAQKLLKDAAKYGGFEDMNDNKLPDLQREWDKNGDGIPDNYYEASDGYALEAQLMKAINDILEAASSGTSASVLATNSEGEGIMLQAYFQPLDTQTSDSGEEANWLGYLQALWVDSYGNLYEDSNQDARFDSDDQVVTFELIGGETIARVGGVEGVGGDIRLLNELLPIFEAGKQLATRSSLLPRKIFTFIDQDKNGEIDTGELIDFDLANAAELQPYLGVRDDTKWGNAGARLGATLADRTANIITWVRGTDVPGLRNRTLNGLTWPLGDIVNSTPVNISKPPDQYHIWYGDESYQPYFEKFKDRENVIYVGSNGGMLHAFSAGTYDRGLKQYSEVGDERLGDELWAFIPQTVLPHLKWVAQENYTHTYLVDAKPRIFDAKIIPNGTHYTGGDGEDGWGTILVMGMKMGAKKITVNEDFGSGVLETRTFDPSYICMDITDPRNPRLLWERTYPGLSMSYSTPEPVKVGDKWFLVFGSGPTDYNGNSSQAGNLYVVDMKTGDLLRQFGSLDPQAFFGTGVAFDKNLNYNVDAVYIGNAFYASNRWQGSLFKLAIPCANCPWEYDYDANQEFGYDTDPANWHLHKLFASDRPITGTPMVSTEFNPDIVEPADNVWVYFGTGRYLSEDDKITNTQQYLYGIKDPLYNYTYIGSYLHDYDQAKTKILSRSDLFRGDTITVTTAGHVLQGGSLFGTGDFRGLVKVVRNYDGWYHSLETNGTAPSERSISMPSVIGGITLFPTFTPSSDICKAKGVTNFYGLYYLTGTAYTKQIFNIENPATIYVTVDGTTNLEEVVAVKLEKPLTGSPPPSAGIHSGRQRGGKAYLQMSTGQVVEIDFETAIYFKSTITDWWDR
jgi:type IV pilus assembly protein PilY1